MNIKLLPLSVSFIFLCLPTIGQNKLLFDNATVEYRIIKTPTRLLDSNKIELSQTLIQVSLTTLIRNNIMNLKFDDWMNLLSNKDTDWAANLCLYDIYKKDAFLYSFEMRRKNGLTVVEQLISIIGKTIYLNEKCFFIPIIHLHISSTAHNNALPKVRAGH